MRAAIVLALLACVARAEDIVVRVTFGDEPMENATVKVLKKDEAIAFDRTKWAADKLTDESGQAVVDVPEGGKVLVYVPGYALAVATVDRIPLDIELKPERIYEGRVVDSAGEPIVGASLSLSTTFKRGATFVATSDKQGHFFVYGLWLDDYSVLAEATGYLPSGIDTDAEGGVITLYRSASIRGALVDNEGKAVRGVDLYVLQRAPSDDGTDAQFELLVEPEVAEDGTFAIKELDSGTYTVAAASPYGGSTRVEIQEGEQRGGVRIVVTEPATLRMRFVDGTGNPLPFIGHACGKETSDKEGRLVLRVRPETRGEIRVKRKGWFKRKLAYGPEPPGGDHDLGDVILEAIRPAKVVVRLPDGTPAQQGTVSDVPIKDGSATLPEPGTYSVNVPGFPEVDISAPGELTLPEPRWLDGVVLNTDGTPVEGAVVLARRSRGIPVADAKTDTKGVFRVGPLAGPRIGVSVSKAGKQTAWAQVMLSEGRLLVELVDAAPVTTVRGTVTRDGRPVQDFTVNDTRFLDEEGRFEIAVDRSDTRWIRCRVSGIQYVVPLPPIGTSLEINVPTGRITVEIGRITKPTSVALRRSRGPRFQNGLVALRTATEAGAVHFDSVAPGTYSIHADGFETVEARPGDTVRLLRATGRLRVLLPPGYWLLNPVPPEVPAGKDSIWALGYNVDLLVRTEVARGEETVLDLAGKTEVVISVKDARRWSLDGDGVTYSGDFPKAGVVRIRNVLAGEYRLSAGIHRRTVMIEGASVEFELGAGTLALSGSVQLDGGRPAQGASVQLLAEGDENSDHKWEVVTDLAGRFEFKGLVPGTYLCYARLSGYATAVATVTVTEAGLADGVRMILTKATGVQVRVVGLFGERLPDVRAKVNGLDQVTDQLGYLTLDELPATVNLDHPGYASIRGMRITGPGTIQLERGADLVVLLDPEAGELEVMVDGQIWDLPTFLGERLVLRDLPPGPLQITQTPEEREDEEAEPRIVQTRLIAGEQITVDLRE